MAMAEVVDAAADGGNKIVAGPKADATKASKKQAKKRPSAALALRCSALLPRVPGS